MPNLLSRVVALLLVPCLLAEPVTASVLAYPVPAVRPARLPSAVFFDKEAITPHLVEAFRLPFDRLAAYLSRWAPRPELAEGDWSMLPETDKKSAFAHIFFAKKLKEGSPEAWKKRFESQPAKMLELAKKIARSEALAARDLRRRLRNQGLKADAIAAIVRDFMRTFGSRKFSDLLSKRSIRKYKVGRTLSNSFLQDTHDQFEIKLAPESSYRDLAETAGKLQAVSMKQGDSITGKLFGRIRDALLDMSESAGSAEPGAIKPGVWTVRSIMRKEIVGLQFARKIGPDNQNMPFLQAVNPQGIEEGLTAVVPEFQLRGAGKLLLDESLKYGRSRNLRYRLLKVDASDVRTFKWFFDASIREKVPMRYLGTIPGVREDRDVYLTDRRSDETRYTRMPSPLRGPFESAREAVEHLRTRYRYAGRAELSAGLLKRGLFRLPNRSLSEMTVAAEPPETTSPDVLRYLDVLVDPLSPLQLLQTAEKELSESHGYRIIQVNNVRSYSEIHHQLGDLDDLILSLAPEGMKLTGLKQRPGARDVPVSEAMTRTLDQLVNNIYRHGDQMGVVLIRPIANSDGKGLEIIARDAGPGIDDLQKVFRSGRKSHDAEENLLSVRDYTVHSGFGTFTVESNGQRIKYDRSGEIENTNGVVLQGTLVAAKFLFPKTKNGGVQHYAGIAEEVDVLRGKSKEAGDLHGADIFDIIYSLLTLHASSIEKVFEKRAADGSLLGIKVLERVSLKGVRAPTVVEGFMAVSPDARRQGIGRALSDAGNQYAADNGIRYMLGVIATTNETQHRLIYQSAQAQHVPMIYLGTLLSQKRWNDVFVLDLLPGQPRPAKMPAALEGTADEAMAALQQRRQRTDDPDVTPQTLLTDMFQESRPSGPGFNIKKILAIFLAVSAAASTLWASVSVHIPSSQWSTVLAPVGIYGVLHGFMSIVGGSWDEASVSLDVSETVKAMVQRWQQRAAEKGIQLETVMPQEPLYIDNREARRKRGEWLTGSLRDEVVSELIFNALKYSRRGEKIQIVLRREGTDAVFAVHDSGIGIAPEDVVRIWNDGYRGENARVVKDETGNGQGLSQARLVVEDYGGSVSVESQGQGLGATFTVRIPIGEVLSDSFRKKNPAAGMIILEPLIGIAVLSLALLGVSIYLIILGAITLSSMRIISRLWQHKPSQTRLFKTAA